MGGFNLTFPKGLLGLTLDWRAGEVTRCMALPSLRLSVVLSKLLETRCKCRCTGESSSCCAMWSARKRPSNRCNIGLKLNGTSLSRQAVWMPRLRLDSAPSTCPAPQLYLTWRGRSRRSEPSTASAWTSWRSRWQDCSG